MEHTYRNLVYLSDTGGTGKWRRIFQINSIECIAQNINTSVSYLQFPVLTPDYYKGITSVTVQRWISDQQEQIFFKLLKPVCDANSGWLLYEIDDAMHYTDIVNYNRGRRAFVGEKVQSNIKRMLNAADLVTVTTDRIKQYYHEKYNVPNENIVCVPNLIPKHWIGDKYDVDKKLNQFARNKAKPRIGIVSSLSHYNIDNIREDQNGKAVFETKTSDGTIKYINEDNVEVNFADTKPITDDLDEIINVIRETVNDFQWVFFGYCPPKLEDLAKSKKIEVFPGQPIVNYPSVLNNLNLQAIVAPIKKTTFNFCKSPIKYLECCAIGVPLFATNCPPYSDYMDSKFLFDSDIDLKAKLMKLKFSSSGAYRQIIETNWKWLNSPHRDGDFNLKNYWLEDNLGIWVSLFKLRQKTLVVSLKSIVKQMEQIKEKQKQLEEQVFEKTDDPEVVILK